MTDINMTQLRQATALIDSAKKWIALREERKADPAAREAHGILRQWAKMPPGDAGLARQISQLCVGVGDVLANLDFCVEAQASFEQGLAIFEMQAQADPSDLDLQQDLWDVHLKLAEMHAANSCLDWWKALPSCRASLTIAERIATSYPRSDAWQHNLSTSHMKLGEVLSEIGLRNDALAHFQVAATLAEKLEAAEPDDTASRRHLASAYSYLAGNYLKTGRWDQALEFIGRMAGLIPQRTTERTWKQVQSMVDHMMSSIDQHKRLGIDGRLKADDPLQPEWQGSLGWPRGGVSTIVGLRSSDLPAWLAFYLEKLPYLASTIEKHPDNPDCRCDLAMLYERIGDLQTALGNLAEAVGAYEASGAVRNDLALRDPINPRCQRDLALIQAKLGRAYKQAGRMREAIQAFTVGRAAVAQVIERHPYLTAWADDIVWFDQHIESVGA